MEYRHVENGFLIRLEKDDKIIENLNEFARLQKIPSGFVYGIGAIKEAELGYFDLSEKTYRRKEFTGEYELVSLKGNLSYLQDEPVYHIHVAMAGPDFQLVGGHLFEARVAVTVEIHFLVNNDMVERQFDSETGLNLLDLL